MGISWKVSQRTWFLCCVVFVVFGLQAQQSADRILSDEYTIALASQPDLAPAERFHPSHVSSNGEVFLATQLDWKSRDILSARGADQTKVSAAMIPMLPADATSSNAEAVGILIYRGNPNDLRATVRDAVDGGRYGPVIHLNGALVESSTFDAVIALTVQASGRPFANGFVLVEPYVHGRAHALRPERSTMPLAIFSSIGALFFLLGLTSWFFGPARALGKEKGANADDANAPDEAQPA